MASRELSSPLLVLACSKEGTTGLWNLVKVCGTVLQYKSSDQKVFGKCCLFVFTILQHADSMKMCKKYMSCVARIGQCRAVCSVLARTKEFLNKAMAAAGNQVREQICIGSVQGQCESKHSAPPGVLWCRREGPGTSDSWGRANMWLASQQINA